jgi:hypothetical protein
MEAMSAAIRPPQAHIPFRRALLVHDGTAADAARDVALPGGAAARVEAATFDAVADRIDALALDPPAVVLLATEGPATVRPTVRLLRERSAFARTRLYVFQPPEHARFADADDVEATYDAGDASAERVADAVRNGLRAFEALGENPLVPRYYLDAKLNDVFGWFEESRWEWSELGDLGAIRRDLLTAAEIEITKQACIAEFGTLPGAHNFLREWFDEYSFSSWAVAWGAEEARHAMVLARCLRALGVEVLAKHAMYKREPYPMGETRAGTLMMNVISESRASEYYKGLYRTTREPILRNVWRLLSRDESRHASAFFAFCSELCEQDEAQLVPALEMAYVWLADRAQGMKHPSGVFYPHSPSTDGFRLAERHLQTHRPSVTDDADARVLSMVRKLTGDASIESTGGIRAWLRRHV